MKIDIPCHNCLTFAKCLTIFNRHVPCYQNITKARVVAEILSRRCSIIRKFIRRGCSQFTYRIEDAYKVAHYYESINKGEHEDV